MHVILLTVVLACKWISYTQDELIIEPQMVMLGSMTDLYLEGISGGTDNLQIEFTSFDYCPKRSVLKATGTIKEKITGEQYPFVSIANAEVDRKIIPKSAIFKTDTNGRFSIEMPFRRTDKLIFFNVGTEVIVVRMEEK